MPGDVLSIPDKQQKNEQAPTGQVSTYRVRSKALLLKLVLRDFDNQPMPGLHCELNIEGQQIQLTSDGQGMIQTKLPPTAVNGTLKIPDLDLEMPVQIWISGPACRGSRLARPID